MTLNTVVCFASEDADSHRRLLVSLGGLKRRGLVDLWSRNDLVPGASTEEELASKLNAADLIILLVSPDFLALESCHRVELPLALTRHHSGQCDVIPVVVRPADWRRELGPIQELPRGGRPISGHTDKDQAWLEVASEIEKIVERRDRRKAEDLTARIELISRERDDLKQQLEVMKRRLEGTGDAQMSVPAAYRQIFRHHKVLFGHSCRIGDALGSLGLRFERWDPMYYSRPPRSTSEFFRPDYWAWDLMPAHSLRLIWLAPGMRVVLEAVSDSGFKKIGSAEPDPTYFASLSESSSELWLSVFVTTAKKLDWDEVWRKWKAAQRDIDLFNGADHSFDLDGQRHMLRFFEAPTDRLSDDASCRTLLIEPVLRWLNEHRTF